MLLMCVTVVFPEMNLFLTWLSFMTRSSYHAWCGGIARELPSCDGAHAWNPQWNATRQDSDVRNPGILAGFVRRRKDGRQRNQPKSDAGGREAGEQSMYSRTKGLNRCEISGWDHFQWLIVRRVGLMRSQQDFEWWWSVPLSCASLY